MFTACLVVLVICAFVALIWFIAVGPYIQPQPGEDEHDDHV